MSGEGRVALGLIQREPGSTPEDVARCLGFYLGGGRWDAARARRLVGHLVRLGLVKWGSQRAGYFPSSP